MNETIAPKILLIDADPEAHGIVTQALFGTGIGISYAGRGTQGIELASAEFHDLILLDGSLPDISSLEALMLLRDNPKTASTPVMFLVGGNDQRLIADAFDHGSVDVLRKPIYPIELQARIKTVLKTQTMLHRLRYLSLNDPLTRLPNRNGMSHWIQHAAENPSHFPWPYAAIVIGIDRMNNITDLIGHGAGDELTRAVAMRLQSLLSQSSQMDRCCNRYHLSRGPGESFVLLLTGVEGSRAVMGLAANLVESIASAYRIGTEDQFVSASVGVAISREAHGDFHNLIRCADIAYQDARSAGRSHVQMYDPSMEDVLRRKLHLENDLRIATRNRQFLIEYQPVFHLQTRQCEFAESIIRWEHPVHGDVPMHCFRPIADENGLMGEITSWALSNACSQLIQWQYDAPADAPRRISIDVSRKQLLHPQFIEAALETIHQSRLRNDRIQLEIAESEIILDTEGVIDSMKKLRDSGIRIVIDNFGMSFPSFQFMEQFPVDGIKLSRVLIQDLETNPLYPKLLEIIVRQASQSNLSIIVDGVERETQAKALNAIGLHLAQGNLFSKPLNNESFLPFLIEWNQSLRAKPRDAGKMRPSIEPVPERS